MGEALTALPSLTTAVGGELLHTLEVGKQGPPVLLIHGLGASSHIYDALMRAESSRYRFLAVDLPASGRSTRFASLDPGELAAALDGFLGRRKIPQAVVVGHSFGGVVAIELAARYPKRVVGLVVMNSPALGMARVKGLLSNPLAEAAFKMAGSFSPPAFMVRRYLQMIWGEPEAITDAHVRGYLAAMKAEGFFPAMLEGLRHLLTYQLPVAQLRRWAGPRTVLWGERDSLLSVPQAEQLARAMDAPLTLLPRTGHCVPEERPGELAAAIASVAHGGRAAVRRRKGG